ncbi:MAG TPA: Ger(x)C family spore germination protein [Pseudogracilibacillus sp.]|nr:Ger(x)C family spore germination protein [Pseudogracilibacillus sp.]
MNKCMLLLLSVVLLVGCWDERLLKEHVLILSVGYDLVDDKKLMKTSTFPNEPKSGAEGGEPGETETITVVGNTVKDAEILAEQYSPETFDRSKAKVLLIGEDLAKKGMFPTLDSVYRDLRAPLSATIAVVEGTAKDALEITEKYSLLTSDFYADLIDTSDQAGLIKSEDLQSICPVILEEGKDIALPAIALNEKKSGAKLNGLSLFSGDELTGELDLDQSIMFLILSNQTKKRTKVNLQVTEGKEEITKNYVNFSIRDMKRKIKIDTEHHKIKANIKMDLQIEIDEYADDHLHSKKKAKKLKEQINEQLIILAEETIKEMQEANSDTLGIGERIKAYHPKAWKEVDWEKEYPNIEIKPSFSIKIIRHGILN